MKRIDSGGVSTGSGSIADTAFQPVRHNIYYKDLETVRLVLIDPGASQAVKDYYTNLASSASGIAVQEQAPGKVTFVHEGVEYVSCLFGVDIKVDSNNDLVVDNEDNDVENESEFLFWINNDNDWDKDTQLARDNINELIDGYFDLVDMAHLSIRYSFSSAPKNSKLFLSLIPIEGSPSIRLFEKTCEGISYLRDYTEAEEHREKPAWESFLGTLISIVDENEKEIDTSVFSQNNEIQFLFEGVSKGVGALCFVLKDSNNVEIMRDYALIRLHDIDDFWSEINLRRNYGEELGPVQNAMIQFQDWRDLLETDDITWNVEDKKWGRENERVLLFIHGFNNNLDDARKWNRCIFKRLYWQGYKGNQIGVMWVGDKGAAAWFNCNVYNAFETGYAFGTQLPNLKTVCGNRKLILFSHSLGVIVASQAIINNDPNMVYKYIMSEAAVSRRAFLSDPMEPGDEYSEDSEFTGGLLALAREYGYRDFSSPNPKERLDFDEMWQTGGGDSWWPDNALLADDPQDHRASQPDGSEPGEAVVNYKVRWRDIYNKDENGNPRNCYEGSGTPWGQIFKEVPEKLECRLYCSHSHNDAMVSPHEWEGSEVTDPSGEYPNLNAWMSNQFGIGPFGGAPDCHFDERLYRQPDYTVNPVIITKKSRRWAELSWYFCSLQLAAGFDGIGTGTKYISVDNESRGVLDHSSMIVHPYYDIGTSPDQIGTWSFWHWLYESIEIENN